MLCQHDVTITLRDQPFRPHRDPTHWSDSHLLTCPTLGSSSVRSGPAFLRERRVPPGPARPTRRSGPRLWAFSPATLFGSTARVCLRSCARVPWPPRAGSTDRGRSYLVRPLPQQLPNEVMGTKPGSRMALVSRPCSSPGPVRLPSRQRGPTCPGLAVQAAPTRSRMTSQGARGPRRGLRRSWQW